jgi:ABC-2 type transport system ATP-binding protein
MAQKLGLAATFQSRKTLFLLDEPLSGLDPKARAVLKNHFNRLRSMGRTLFFSTHLLADVDDLCDRIGILHGGVLQFVGSPQACCERFNASNLEQAFLRCIAG